MVVSGLDLNVERQTSGLLRCHAKNRHPPRPVRVFAAHVLLALSTFRRCVAAHRGEHKPRDQTGKRGPLLTHNFALKPELIADLYYQR